MCEMRVLRKILIYIAKNSRPSIDTVGRLAISRHHTCRCQEWEENSRRHITPNVACGFGSLSLNTLLRRSLPQPFCELIRRNNEGNEGIKRTKEVHPPFCHHTTVVFIACPVSFDVAATTTTAHISSRLFDVVAYKRPALLSYVFYKSTIFGLGHGCRSYKMI
uniref:Uncharacterized protein n=1 Tax=Cucumis melo TaxID=3656 RepID=A0A9I9EJE7_CUCME